MKILLPFLFILAVGCASVPIAQIETILKSDILSPNHVVSIQDKKEIKTALESSEKEIKKDESQIKALSFWSFWGKIGAAVIFVFLLICVIKKTLF